MILSSCIRCARGCVVYLCGLGSASAGPWASSPELACLRTWWTSVESPAFCGHPPASADPHSRLQGSTPGNKFRRGWGRGKRAERVEVSEP